MGDELKCILNPNEIVSFKPGDTYQVERVLKTRKRKGGKQLFVKWLHYPEKFNSWVNESDVFDVKM